MKSLSRSYIYDSEAGGENGVQDDDLDVYHTITGGKLRSITATRSTDPYSKITRRPLHKLLSGQRSLLGKTESLASLADVETDSVLSWGRVRPVSTVRAPHTTHRPRPNSNTECCMLLSTVQGYNSIS